MTTTPPDQQAIQQAAQRAARQVGQLGEDAAAAHLQKKGLRVLARNWRHGRLELDMVCTEGHTVVFVEVKTRKAGGMTSPQEALTPRKQNALLRAAQHWLNTHEAWDKSCRFDLVAVLDHGAHFTLEHYQNVFEFSAPVGGRHASWQPW